MCVCVCVCACAARQPHKHCWRVGGHEKVKVRGAWRTRILAGGVKVESLFNDSKRDQSPSSSSAASCTQITLRPCASSPISVTMTAHGRTIRLLPLNGASRRIFDRKCACEQHKKVRVGYVTRGQGVAGRARVCGGRTPWWKPRMTIPPVIVAVSHGRQSVASTGVSPAPRPIQWPRSVTIHAMFSLRRAGDSPFVF